MDRLARNLDDLRALVQGLTRKGVRVEFIKEQLVFTGEDSPMANLMLSVMGAFAEFERSLIRERQREGIALAKQRGAYRGRKKTLTPERAGRDVSCDFHPGFQNQSAHEAAAAHNRGQFLEVIHRYCCQGATLKARLPSHG
jgi:DNA invertase Pin-like site-specific DNA recombinase